MSSATPKSILVTGGSGFVGRHLISRLLVEGRRVTATSTRPPHDGFEGEGLEWVCWDARRSPAPDIEWNRVECVVHLAKPNDPFDPIDHRANNFALSIAATFHLLEKARAHGVERFILASTGYALGAGGESALETSSEYQPHEFYGAAKACAELLTRSYADEMATVVVRFFFPYGPGGEKFFVNRIARAVQGGREIRIDGDEGVTLNPIWIDDLIAGLVAVIDSGGRGVFHLAGPESISLRRLAEMVGERCGRAPVWRYVSAARATCHVGDGRRSRVELGFAPQVTVREGLTRLMNAEVEVATC